MEGDALWQHMIDTDMIDHFWHHDHYNGHGWAMMAIEESLETVAKAANEWLRLSCSNSSRA